MPSPLLQQAQADPDFPRLAGAWEAAVGGVEGAVAAQAPRAGADAERLQLG